MRKILLSALFAAISAGTMAGNYLEGVEYYARIGYSIGGTAPLPMPPSVRKLNHFSLSPNFLFGADAVKPLHDQWSVMVGIRFENKGMDEEVQVKSYHMAMQRGGEALVGRFTGNVATHVKAWQATLPVQALFKLNNVNLRFGPYFSYVLFNTFRGSAYGGYLRLGDPTGGKVNIGTDPGTQGVYDFTSDMRHFQWGLGLGADWYFYRRLGASADITWGLNGVHKTAFKTIEQTLHPIYFTLGMVYKIH